MNLPYKLIIILFIILFVISIFTGFIYCGTFNLLIFINSSFLISSIVIFLSLLLFITKNGFFDGITYGFRKLFASKQADKNLAEDISTEMRPPSELVQPVSAFPLFAASLLLFLCMIAALAVFYNS